MLDLCTYNQNKPKYIFSPSCTNLVWNESFLRLDLEGTMTFQHEIKSHIQEIRNTPKNVTDLDSVAA